MAALLSVVAPACAGSTPARSSPGASTAVPPTGAPEAPTTSPAASVAPAAVPTSSWTTYQDGNSRLGDAASQPALTPVETAWSADLDGSAVYGQPLLAGGRVIVATEDDDVYALDPHDGRVVWQQNVGTPLRGVAAAAGCGDIDPLGITSTPVYDPASGTVYVVAEVSSGGTVPVHHQLVGIDVATGARTLSLPADPDLIGQDPVHLLQRAALALADGRVYVSYGGQAGDCGSYHGWLVGLSPTGAPPVYFDVTPSSSGGALWNGGAGPAVGADGTLFVTTGNPNSGGPSPWAESVLELRAGLGPDPEAAFQDRAASGDEDLSTGGPVLLPGGEVFAAGKTETGFLLSRSGLIPLATVSGRICGSDPDGGAAFDPATDSLYLPCRDGGVQQVDLARRATGWLAGETNSTVVLAEGELWSLAYPSGRLQALDPVSGRLLATVAVGRKVPTFASLSIVDGLILVPTTAGVAALAGPGGPPA